MAWGCFRAPSGSSDGEAGSLLTGVLALGQLGQQGPLA